MQCVVSSLACDRNRPYVRFVFLFFFEAPCETLSKIVPVRHVWPCAFKRKEADSSVHQRSELEHQVYMQAFCLVCLEGCAPALDTPLLQTATHETNEAVEMLQASKATVGEQHHLSLHPVLFAPRFGQNQLCACSASWSSSLRGTAAQHQFSSSWEAPCIVRALPTTVVASPQRH